MGGGGAQGTREPKGERASEFTEKSCTEPPSFRKCVNVFYIYDIVQDPGGGANERGRVGTVAPPLPRGGGGGGGGRGESDASSSSCSWSSSPGKRSAALKGRKKVQVSPFHGSSFVQNIL